MVASVEARRGTGVLLSAGDGPEIATALLVAQRFKPNLGNSPFSRREPWPLKRGRRGRYSTLVWGGIGPTDRAYSKADRAPLGPVRRGQVLDRRLPSGGETIRALYGAESPPTT